MNELYNESTCQASRMCGFLLKILLLILSLYLNYIPTFSELMIIPSIHYLKFENQHFKYPGILQMCNSFSHSWKAPKTPKDWYKGEYCLELATTTTIFLSLVFSVHWNVIDKNDFNEVQILFALHWGHFCQWHFNVHWIQGLRKLLLLLPSLNNIPPYNKVQNQFLQILFWFQISNLLPKI